MRARCKCSIYPRVAMFSAVHHRSFGQNCQAQRIKPLLTCNSARRFGRMRRYVFLSMPDGSWARISWEVARPHGSRLPAIGGEDFWGTACYAGRSCRRREKFSPVTTWAVIKPCLAVQSSHCYVEKLFKALASSRTQSSQIPPSKNYSQDQELRSAEESATFLWRALYESISWPPLGPRFLGNRILHICGDKAELGSHCKRALSRARGSSIHASWTWI
jgi:hypothetical protein